MLIADLDLAPIVLCVPMWLAFNALWYSPLTMNSWLMRGLFGTAARARFGREQWLMVPVALATAFGLGVLLDWYQTSGGHVGWTTGAGMGAFAWACFGIPLKVLDLIYRPRRLELFVLEMLNLLIALAGMGALIGWWEAR